MTIEQMVEIVRAHENDENKPIWDYIRQREAILVDQILASDEESLKDKGFLKGVRWVLNINKTLREDLERERKKANRKE